MIEKGNIYDVLIEKVVFGGNGLARKDNFVIFIPDVLEGEFVKVEITKAKKNHAFAKLIEIINPSINRIKPPCPYYYKCGGCQLQFADYKEQISIKEKNIREFFSYIKDIEVFPSDNPFNYRNKVLWRKNNHNLGLTVFNTNDIVDIDKCMIADKYINEYYGILRGMKDSISNNSEITMRASNLSEIMISSSKKMDIDDYFMKNVNSLYLADKKISGNDYINMNIENIKFPVFPSSFFQVNTGILLKILDFLKKNVRGKALFDAYCGTGIFSIALRNNFEKIIGVDIESSNIESANIIKKENNFTNLEFYTGNVKNFIEKTQYADTIIIDPPRKGCSREVINGILSTKPQNVVYISCDPSTLKRDIETLKESYKIKKLAIFDMFPQTYHFETICILNYSIEFSD
ncbi:MAG: class I SAM-dependent RNA methyltransferase [Candidatus Muirbacterium halophilum]|nr:class I SAM-dependent RNA methyltransferase [Candidatus Muirbacterium halophilum]MCK9476193.1 class I SAM-dependent RNA methyltransferase [Candidatus Muirbacterium halophilum]